MNEGGRPRLFEDTEEGVKRFNDIVKSYFESIDIENYEKAQMGEGKYRKAYSMGKLALALGMTSETLYQYEQNPLFSETIKKAREKVREDLLEKALIDQSVASVSIFALKALHGLRETDEKKDQTIQIVLDDKLKLKND